MSDRAPELGTAHAAIGSPVIGDGQRPAAPSDLAAIEDAVVARARRRLRRDAIRGMTAPFVFAALLIAAWEAMVAITGIAPYLLPPPSAIARSMIENASTLFEHSIATMTAVAVALGVAVVIGIAFALVTFHSRLFRQAVYPLFVLFQAVPKVAVAPLFAVWFGFTITTKAGIGFLIAVFPVIINTLLGLESLPAEKLHLAQTMGLRPTRMFLTVRLPQALPAMFGGFKNAFSLAMIGAIIGEFVGGSEGLGYLMLRSNRDFDGPLLFAALTVLAVYSVVLFLVLEWIERRLLPWHQRATDHHRWTGSEV
jgi:NitT/TauT family transport system permease protein